MTAFVLDPKDPNCENVRANLHRFIDQLPKTKAWEWTWKRHQKERNDPQNRALWGVAYKALREQSGNDVDDLHTFFCGEFFGWVDTVVMGQRKRKPFRTTTHDENGKRSVMPMSEFADFYDFISQRSAENGFHVPAPDPLWREQKAA